MRRGFGNLLLSFVLLGATMVCASGKRAAPVSENNALKAEYVFLETANYCTDSSASDRYMLLRHAHRLNPEDRFIAGALAEIEIGLDNKATNHEVSYQRLRDRFYANPLDQDYSHVFWNVAYYYDRYDDAIAVWELLDSLQPNRTDPAMNMGLLLLAKGSATGDTASIMRAIGIYERLQETLPGNLKLISSKIQAYDALNDSSSALREIRKAVQDAPRDRNMMLLAERMYQRYDMMDSALVLLTRLGELYPDDGIVSMERSRFFYQQGDTVKYLDELHKAIESPNVEFGDKFVLFRDYLSRELSDSTSTDETGLLFAGFVESNPGEAELHKLYGEFLFEKEDYEGAAEQFRYSVDLDATQQDTWDELIQAYAHSGDVESLRTTSSEAAERFRTDIYAALNAALITNADGDTERAIEYLDNVIFVPTQSAKARADIYMLKGDFYSSLENVDSALVCYNRSIELNADGYMAMNNAAYLMAVHEIDLPRAELYASIACAAEPNSPTFLDTYAWVFYKKGEYWRASDYILQALTIIESDEDSREMDNFELYNHAGDIAMAMGETEKAAEFWEKALALHPDDEDVQNKLNGLTE